MSKGAKTIADLDRAIRTLQRRARDDRTRIADLEHRADLDEQWLRDVAFSATVSPATCPNSTPPLPRRFAGAALGNARLFFSRVSTWAASLFLRRRDMARDGNT